MAKRFVDPDDDQAQAPASPERLPMRLRNKAAEKAIKDRVMVKDLAEDKEEKKANEKLQFSAQAATFPMPTDREMDGDILSPAEIKANMEAAQWKVDAQMQDEHRAAKMEAYLPKQPLIIPTEVEIKELTVALETMLKLAPKFSKTLACLKQVDKLLDLLGKEINREAADALCSDRSFT